LDSWKGENANVCATPLGKAASEEADRSGEVFGATRSFICILILHFTLGILTFPKAPPEKNRTPHRNDLIGHIAR